MKLINKEEHGQQEQDKVAAPEKKASDDQEEQDEDKAAKKIPAGIFHFRVRLLCRSWSVHGLHRWLPQRLQASVDTYMRLGVHGAALDIKI
jgi:hypothetical protein